jgi:hypothetical protein
MFKGLSLIACVLVMCGVLHTARSSRQAAQAATDVEQAARKYTQRVQDAIQQTEQEWGGTGSARARTDSNSRVPGRGTPN